MAMEGTWAPWTYHDDNNDLVGYDVEVAQNIAEKLGVEVEFVEGEWDGLLAGLETGRYDIMVNGVGVTKERAESTISTHMHIIRLLLSFAAITMRFHQWKI